MSLLPSGAERVRARIDVAVIERPAIARPTSTTAPWPATCPAGHYKWGRRSGTTARACADAQDERNYRAQGGHDVLGLLGAVEHVLSKMEGASPTPRA